MFYEGFEYVSELQTNKVSQIVRGSMHIAYSKNTYDLLVK